MLVADSTTAEHYNWGTGCDGWRLLDAPDLSVTQERVPPGASEVRHLHHKAHQFFYILEGEAVIEIGGTDHRLGPRQGVEVGPGTPHRFRNESNADVNFLVISAPASRGDRVEVD